MAPAQPKASPRRIVVDSLRQLAKQAGGGRYTFVKRGGVNWAAFDFSQHRCGLCILLPVGTLRGGYWEYDLTLELFHGAGIPSDPASGTDDGVLDSLHDDALWIIEGLMQLQVCDVVLKDVSAWQEVVDPDNGITGLLANAVLKV